MDSSSKVWELLEKLMNLPSEQQLFAVTLTALALAAFALYVMMRINGPANKGGNN